MGFLVIVGGPAVGQYCAVWVAALSAREQARGGTGPKRIARGMPRQRRRRMNAGLVLCAGDLPAFRHLRLRRDGKSGRSE